MSRHRAKLTAVPVLVVFLASMALTVSPVRAAGEYGSSPTASTARLITFPGHGANVRLHGGMNRLHGVSRSFKRYVRKQLKALLRVYPAAQKRTCANAALVSVQRYDTGGWAYVGDIGLLPGKGAPASCARGGNWAIWHAVHGRWRTVLGGQDLPSCGDLQSRGVPASVWAQNCYSANNEVVYNGPSSGTTSAGCEPAALFAAAVAAEGFDPSDSSYVSMSGPDAEGAHDVLCYDGWATAQISRPNTGTTDGGTLFRASGAQWAEVKEIGAAMPCTLRAAGVPESDIPHLAASTDSPIYCG